MLQFKGFLYFILTFSIFSGYTAKAGNLQTNTNNLIEINPKTVNALWFSFGTSEKTAQGKLISSPIAFDSETGFGFDFNTVSNVKINSKTFTSQKPVYFSAVVPEGNYQVEITMGSLEKKSNITLKTESRRLLLDQFSIKKGKLITRTFNVNVRNIKIDDSTSISLKDREKETLDWDTKLTLEFLGDVSVQNIKIIPETNLTVLYLAGDSTVTDQDVEPWASWGQFITNYFDTSIVVANYAYSGASLSSFKNSNRLKKILSLIKKGDYLFVEFGHNDEKIKGAGNGPWESYSNLLKEFINAAKDKGAIPVLVTPTQRRFFNENGTLKETHGDFPAAMRTVAQKNDTALIDLTKTTKTLYESWGDSVSRNAFVQYPAHTFPGQEKALDDNTHFNSFGANEIALCILQGIRELNLPLKKQILKETPAYNPKKPNSITAWKLPMSERFEIAKPEGN
ncbi:rhamnogalacturonan acetylesterase [Flavobacterium reichenbachii]|uniref:rhamnogalacturonan acetylesterase n=1 Tax=Flavobacterium reichenbachii TaxID=362418 RepID=UPI001F0A729D|nr:rhamnogalacturonan acetylesterase [Flavobacterium reichenbachii]